MMRLKFWRRWDISFLGLILHAKRQTLNIYPMSSAPNRLGIHSELAHLGYYYIEGVDIKDYINRNSEACDITQQFQ